jgi:hypothetical protein
MADRKTEFRYIESLAELRRRLQRPGLALRLFEWLRWPDGRFCPHCGGFDHLPIEGRQKTGLYHCRDCRKQFSATSGTPLHKTKLPIETWMEAAFLVASSSKGVSSVVLARQLGVQQKTAWKIGHAIRLMMVMPDRGPQSGAGEIDDRALGVDPKLPGLPKYRAAPIRCVAGRPGHGRRRRTLPAVDRGVGEHAHGDTGANAVEALRLFAQRAKFGVWHRWSESHEKRYLVEISFHWSHRPRFRRLTVAGRRSRQMIVRSTPIIPSDADDLPERRRPSADSRGDRHQRDRAQDVGRSASTCCVSRLEASFVEANRAGPFDGGARQVAGPEPGAEAAAKARQSAAPTTSAPCWPCRRS